MSLNWDVSKIENNKEVCFTGEGENRCLDPVTNTLIWYTLCLGIGEISEKTVDEFYIRMNLFDRLSTGPMHWEAAGYRSITLEELRQHIGLHTNVGRGETRNKWFKHKIDGVVRDLEYDLRKQVA